MAAPRNRRGRARRRHAAGTFGVSLRLGMLFTFLIGVNVYVFFLRGDTSIRAIMKQSAIPTQKSSVPKAEKAVLVTGSVENEVRIVEGEIGTGRTFGAILRDHEISANMAEGLIAALRAEVEFRTIQPSVEYRIELDPITAQPIAGHMRVSATDTVRFVHDEQGYMVERVTEELKTDLIAIGGVVERSLYESIEASGEHAQVIAPFVDAFAWDLDFYSDQHPGDRFKIIAEKRFLRGEFYSYGRVLAAEYDGKRGKFQAFWHDGAGGSAGYYDEKGQSVQRSFLRTPLQFVRISSRFGRRYHPILHRVKGHMGVDFAAPSGTPVRATASGRVTFAARKGGSGNMVILRHANGYTSLYMHLSKFARGLKSGQTVRQRQIIGYVGQTGLATGPHLHFGLKKNGGYVDPMRAKGSRGNPLGGVELASFRAKAKPHVESLAALTVEAPQRKAARGVSAHR